MESIRYRDAMITSNPRGDLDHAEGICALSFIHDGFLLQAKAAQRLYHGYAAVEPILDYHSHLPVADLAADRRFQNLFEIWLEGDHYKWRAMRANGIAERYCTGDADPYKKFMAWARTVPQTLRNPLYHWTHLELERYFGISELLNQSNAAKIWEAANAKLAQPDLSAKGILRKFKVRALCTSDDPTSDLKDHARLAAEQNEFKICPTFRPDKALAIDDASSWNSWLERLEQASETHISRLPDLLHALEQRHEAFHGHGCRLSDHGLLRCPSHPCTQQQASSIFQKVRGGRSASPEEKEEFGSYLMLFFGHLDAQRGWTKQLHIGALRGVNQRKVREIGSDRGFDTISDGEQAAAFCAYLDNLEQENSLPRVIVYNLNPAANYAFAAAVGSFQDGSMAGKIQLGSAWWFLDQKEGIEWQLNALSQTGLLARFIGMVTDSRSFMSFPRHEYFRRVLCNLIGSEMESGILPNDEKLVGEMVRKICYENAREYLGLDALTPSAVLTTADSSLRSE